MAGMFDNPYVFNRAPILGDKYSPQSLYPGLFGEGGMFAHGGALGPPTQNVSRGTPPVSILPFPMPGQDGPPPGLLPWDPLPEQPPVLQPPAGPPAAQAAPQYQEMPQNVQWYIARTAKGQAPGDWEAAKWLRENQGSLSPVDAAKWVNAQQLAREKQAIRDAK